MGTNGDSYKRISSIGQNGEEEQCVQEIKKGNKVVFEQVFKFYYDSLLRFAFRYVESEVVAEGLVQDVFLWVWDNREEWNVEEKLSTYLYRAVKYKAVDHWRHERTKQKYMEDFSERTVSHTEPQTIDEAQEDKFVQHVQNAIEELPKRARMVYKLSRLEGLTYREIADVLEISPKTVETHMSRALDSLRKQLSEYKVVRE